jgi:hypothetical protein
MPYLRPMSARFAFWQSVILTAVGSAAIGAAIAGFLTLLGVGT